MKVNVFNNSDKVDFSKPNLLESKYHPNVIIMNISGYEDYEEEMKGGRLFTGIAVSVPDMSNTKIGDIFYQEDRKEWFKSNKTVQLKND